MDKAMADRAEAERIKLSSKRYQGEWIYTHTFYICTYREREEGAMTG